MKSRHVAFALVAFVALGILWASGAFAGQAVLTWVQPTQNIDGTPVGTLTSNRAQYKLCTATTWTSVAVSPPATTVTIPSLGEGTWCFRVYASTAAGESAASAQVQKTIAPPLPKAPTTLTAK